MIRELYHCSTWNVTAKVGDVLTLKPGTQNAQGIGVYLSEGKPDLRASDSCRLMGVKTIFCLQVEASRSGKDWYVSKGSRDKKKGRPRTWHSQGKNIEVTVTNVKNINGITYIYGNADRV